MTGSEGRVVLDARALLAGVPTGGAGLVVTDPPWDLAGAGRFNLCASYPRLSVEEVAEVMLDARRALVPGGHLYLFAPAGDALAPILAAFTSGGWEFLRALAWDKGTHRGLGAYRNAWEPVLVFSNGASRGFDGPPCSFSSLLKARSVEVRTAKPWQLYRVFMEMSSRPGELVVDPFCGLNPLEEAARYVRPRRRWLAGDVFTPREVAAQAKDRKWEQAGGTGAESRGWSPVTATAGQLGARSESR